MPKFMNEPYHHRRRDDNADDDDNDDALIRRFVTGFTNINLELFGVLKLQ